MTTYPKVRRWLSRGANLSQLIDGDNVFSTKFAEVRRLWRVDDGWLWRASVYLEPAQWVDRNKRRDVGYANSRAGARELVEESMR